MRNRCFSPCLCHVHCLLVSEGPDIALFILFNFILELARGSPEPWAGLKMGGSPAEPGTLGGT